VGSVPLPTTFVKDVAYICEHLKLLHIKLTRPVVNILVFWQRHPGRPVAWGMTRNVLNGNY